MSDYFEIDFLGVETKKSGDAIGIRYTLNNQTFIHVVDGGFQATGVTLKNHINSHYGNPTFIDHVVLTHHDGDHAGGLREILESFSIGTLWMLRPWDYAEELLPHFHLYGSVESLRKRLKDDFPNIVALDEIATRRGITVRAPFQGAAIGAFTVMAPSRKRYLQLVIDEERTPETKHASARSLIELLESAVATVVNPIRALWGQEVFSNEGPGCVNEMSVVQYANLVGTKILLTGDVGRDGLAEAADFAPAVGLTLPGIDRFQIPHHGSRRNVSTEILDRWLGERLSSPPMPGSEKFTAIVSSALEDKSHPRKSVIRAMIHRGARVFQTEGQTVCTSNNSPQRAGWYPLTPVAYPDEQEE